MAVKDKPPGNPETQLTTIAGIVEPINGPDVGPGARRIPGSTRQLGEFIHLFKFPLMPGFAKG
jgi:hypothetical protein